jgi:hypothetical protein
MNRHDLPRLALVAGDVASGIASIDAALVLLEQTAAPAGSDLVPGLSRC